MNLFKRMAKAREDHAARTSISLPPKLYAAALELQKQLGYGSFSDLMQSLIRKAIKPPTDDKPHGPT